MIKQLLIGSLVMAITVAVQAEMFNLFWNGFGHIISFCRKRLHRFANTGAIIAGVLYILLVTTLNVWIWATTFILVGAFDLLEPALYFSLVSFTTVGFGDITPVHPMAKSMTLLSALIGNNNSTASPRWGMVALSPLTTTP